MPAPAQRSVPYAELLRSRTAEEIGTLLSDTGASDLMEAFDHRLNRTISSGSASIASMAFLRAFTFPRPACRKAP